MPAKITDKEFLRRFKLVHGDYYNYSNSVFSGARKKITVGCPIHGDFEITPQHHYNRKQGCKKCGTTKAANSLKRKYKNLIKEAQEIHGEYVYMEDAFINTYKEKIQIFCKKHGVFMQSLYHHINKKQGCPECKNNMGSIMDSKIYFSKAKEVHNDRYDYSNSIYLGNSVKIEIGCREKNHGTFWQEANSHLQGFNCPKCSGIISKGEQEIYDFILSIYPDALQSERTILEGKELDIYIPSKRLAIEHNGLFWHSDLYKSKTHLSNKILKCEKKDIKLINIFEDEWAHNKTIVKKILLNYNKDRKQISKKCNVKELSREESDSFMKNNSLELYCKSSIRLGIFDKEDIVSSISALKIVNNSLVIKKICCKDNKYNNGVLKLFLLYLQTNHNFDNIYIDINNNWVDEIYLESVEKEFIKNIDQDYYFTYNNKRYSKHTKEKHTGVRIYNAGWKRYKIYV